MRHAVPAKPEHLAARGLGRNLHRHLALEGGHRDLAAQGRHGRRNRQLHVQVVALALEARVRGHRHPQVEVAAIPAAVAPSAARSARGHPHPRAVVDAGRDLDVEIPRDLRPAGAMAARAGTTAHVAGAAALRAGLVHLEADRLARAAKRLLERELDAGLHVAASRRAGSGPEAAQVPEVAVLELDAAARPRSFTTKAGPEDRAEEIGEAAEVALLREADVAAPLER